MAKIDFVKAFYRGRYDRHGLIQGLESLLTGHGIAVSAIPFSSTAPLEEVLATLPTGRSVTLERSGDGWQQYRLAYQRTVAKRPIRKEGRFFVYAHRQYANVYIAMTIEPTEFVSHGLVPVLKGKYPQIIRPFVAHERMKRMLVEFKEANQFADLIITRASQRLRFKEEGKHKRVMPVVSWPDMSLEEAFAWVHENDGWFQSIHFQAKDTMGCVRAKVSITRSGAIRADRLFGLAFAGFLQPVCKNHYENVILFSGRSRRDHLRLLSRPLAIEFNTAQFAEVTENAKFIQAMKKMRTASVSVLHGNPYINMSVLDYYDGSTFDVWVLSEDHLVIVPQMKATVAAIKRLINHIFDTYAEGEIRDYAEGTA